MSRVSKLPVNLRKGALRSPRGATTVNGPSRPAAPEAPPTAGMRREGRGGSGMTRAPRRSRDADWNANNVANVPTAPRHTRRPGTAEEAVGGWAREKDGDRPATTGSPPPPLSCSVTGRRVGGAGRPEEVSEKGGAGGGAALPPLPRSCCSLRGKIVWRRVGGAEEGRE